MRLNGIRVAGARNIGILTSSSNFIAFLDDDDLRSPGSIDAQLTALEAAPDAGFVCGAMMIADQDYNLTGEIHLLKSVEMFSGNCWNSIFQ